MFTYLDFIVVNELLDAEELSIVFSDFSNQYRQSNKYLEKITYTNKYMFIYLFYLFINLNLFKNRLAKISSGRRRYATRKESN